MPAGKEEGGDMGKGADRMIQDDPMEFEDFFAPSTTGPHLGGQENLFETIRNQIQICTDVKGPQAGK